MERITLGLPDEIIEDLYWVEDERRTNDLSLTKGGTELVVTYKDGRVLGYDKVKTPSKYVNKIIEEGELEKVFARDSFQFSRRSTNAFKEVWSIIDPLAELENRLKVYDPNYREAENIISHDIIELMAGLKKRRLYFIYETKSGYQIYIEKRIVVGYIYDCIEDDDLADYVTVIQNDDWKPQNNESRIVKISEVVNFEKERDMISWIFGIVEDGVCSIKKKDSESFLKQIILKTEEDPVWVFDNGVKGIDEISVVASLISDRDIFLVNIIA